MKLAAAALVLSCAAACGGCQIEPLRDHPLGCRADEQRLVRDTLYFGAAIPGGGDVSEDDWRRFEADTIAPAFPNGYTVARAEGHWRDAQGNLIGEHTRIVSVIHPDDAVQANDVRTIAADYRARFHQESVLREHSAVCAQF